ncbi:MAG: phage major capsid protein [Alphaproteobacteria bacterium]|nr:phage major capsid protein [Alphaproteobacteria bacterium]
MPTKETELASLKLGKQHRSARLVRMDDTEDSRRVELAFSSEDPYERWWGIEILGHQKGEINLEWLETGQAPLLMDHNARDLVGVVEEASIGTDRKGRAVVRFGKSARAEEIFQDVLDGVRINVSVGYDIHELRLEQEKDGVSTYRVTSWTPLEVSIVSIPADKTVGVGREVESDARDIPIRNERTDPMPEQATKSDKPTAPQTPVAVVDHNEEAEKVRQKELARIQDISAMGREHKLDDAMVEKAIREGVPTHEFGLQVLDHLAKTRPSEVRRAEDPEIGLSERETRSFSFLRAFHALANPTNRGAQEMAAFELEASAAAAERAKISPKGILVPHDVLRSDVVPTLMRAPQSAGVPAAGGNLVATDLLAGSFIDLLRAREVLSQLGATYLTGLNGNIAIPKQTGGAAAYWIADEGGDAAETGVTFGQVPLTPKTLGAFTEVTRQLLLQSSIDVEGLVRGDLVRALSFEISRSGLYGSGAAGQPRGVSNQTGINTTTFAGANPTFAEVVDMETQIASDDADIGTLGYVANAAMRGHFKTTVKFPNTGQTIWEQGGTVNGYGIGVSNQVQAGDAFFANWADLVIGMWGGVDLTVDPYSNSKSGSLRLVVHQTVDHAIRNAESFCHST